MDKVKKVNKVVEKGVIEDINELVDFLISSGGGNFSLIVELYPNDPVTRKNKQPLQFWSVTKELFNKLEKTEEIAVNFLGLYIWGRMTTDKEFNLSSIINKEEK